MDGETYLRLLLERVLADVTSGPAEDLSDMGAATARFHRVSEALVAVGAVDDAVAEDVAAGLHLAVALRTPIWPHGLEPRQRRSWYEGFGPERDDDDPAEDAVVSRTVLACPAVIEADAGRLRLQYLVIGEDGAELAAVATELRPKGAGGPPGRGRGPRPSAAPGPARSGAAVAGGVSVVSMHRRAGVVGGWSASPSSAAPRSPRPRRPPRPGRMIGLPDFDDLTITDQDGREYDVWRSSGGGDGERWEGRLVLEPPPPASMGALVVEGVHVPLLPSGEVEVGEVEALPPEPHSEAERYLLSTAEQSFLWWHRVHPHGDPSIYHDDTEVVAALVAVGTLDPGSPVPSMLDALAWARAHPDEPAPAGLPDSWSYALAHGADGDGPETTVVIGAALPALNDQRVWLDALISEAETWQVHTFVRGWRWDRPGRRMRPGLGARELALSATDDRGGHYVGSMGGSSGSEEGAHVEYRFHPRLDPAATEVRLQVASPNARVTVTVPLGGPGAGE